MFLSGALLLTLELLVARGLLPMVGGSAVAWTTCVAFFQVLLLSGALYAHLTARLGTRRQAILHAGVVLAALAMLPLHASSNGTPSHDNTVLYLVRILATSAGIPCFVLCTTTSLVLQWISRLTGQTAARTYAASNAGSLSGLLAYPFLIEPLLGLADQSRLWSTGFVILAAALSLLIMTVARSGAEPQPETPVHVRPSRSAQWQWFILAFVPCCLLLGVTTHLLTREAFEIYLRKLKPGGLLIFNTSNRHINLSNVVVAVARSLGMQVRVTLPPEANAPDRQAAAEFGTWAVVAKDAADYTPWLDGDDRWVTPKMAAIAPWTDDRTGILPVLRW